MMKYVGVLEAKTHLSRLLDELEKTGEPITITRHGKPLATVLAVAADSEAAELRERLLQNLAGQLPSVARPARRKASAAELVERFRALREMQEPDDISWEELKEEIRR